MLEWDSPASLSLIKIPTNKPVQPCLSFVLLGFGRGSACKFIALPWRLQRCFRRCSHRLLANGISITLVPAELESVEHEEKCDQVAWLLPLLPLLPGWVCVKIGYPL